MTARPCRMSCRRRLRVTFKNTNVPVQILDLDLRAAGSHAAPGIPVGAKDELAVAPLLDGSPLRQRRQKIVAVNATIESLEAEVGRQILREVQLDVPIERCKFRVG